MQTFRVAVLTLALSASVRAQIVVSGVSFVDRGRSGEIALGAIRGGLAVLDYDSDGFPDLFIADNPGLPDRLFRNVPDPQNPGNRTFLDVTAGSGLAQDADGLPRTGFGVVAADYDNDGDPDVFLTGYLAADGTHGLLYRNDGDGVFTNVSVDSGVRASGCAPESASWVDYDLDGRIDLFICCITPSATAFRLLRNNGDGTFSPAAAGALPATGVYAHIYSHLWMDVNGDGYPDGFILNNSNPPILLLNTPDGAGGRRFVNAAAAAGFLTLGTAPMGIAAGDTDGDGHLELSITDASTGTYYRNNGDGTLSRIFPFTSIFGWGTTWIDADNDGRLDNYQAGSFGGANADRLHRNLGGGQWENISAALNTIALPSQHSVQVDFNNDGRQDIITINPGGNPGQFVSIYENVSPAPNHWFKIRLQGRGAMNRDAIGATVRITAGGSTQVRQIISGSSTSATEDLRAHFGLGSATSIDSIEVLWPRAGTLASRTDVFSGPFPADQIVTLTPVCYANCDGSAVAPVLNISDFICFVNRYAAADPYANCDGSTTAPVLNVADFICFTNAYAAGCP